jgi:hypothetical protein
MIVLDRAMDRTKQHATKRASARPLRVPNAKGCAGSTCRKASRKYITCYIPPVALAPEHAKPIYAATTFATLRVVLPVSFEYVNGHELKEDRRMMVDDPSLAQGDISVPTRSAALTSDSNY